MKKVAGFHMSASDFGISVLNMLNDACLAASCKVASSRQCLKSHWWFSYDDLPLCCQKHNATKG